MGVISLFTGSPYSCDQSLFVISRFYWLCGSVGVLSRLVGCRCHDRAELARPPVQCVREVVQVIVRFLNINRGARGRRDGILMFQTVSLVYAVAGFAMALSVRR